MYRTTSGLSTADCHFRPKKARMGAWRNEIREGALSPLAAFFRKKRCGNIRLTSSGSVAWYSKLRNTKTGFAHRNRFRNENTTLEQETAMKEKTINAMHTMLAVTSENLGFVIVWVIAMGVILKLACA